MLCGEAGRVADGFGAPMPPGDAMAACAAAACAAGVSWVLTAPRAAPRRLSKLLLSRHRPILAGLVRSIQARVERLRTRRAERSRSRSSVIELCDGLAAELAAGRPSQAALAEAVRTLDSPIAGSIRAALAMSSPVGIEVADLLERLASSPGAAGLRQLAACWRVGAERGGALVTVIEGLADALRDDEAQRAEVAAQLAGPRATARLLAGLPLLGLMMAAALGADPLAFLFGTVPGLGCLILGVGLDVLGLYWTRRLACAAQPQR